MTDPVTRARELHELLLKSPPGGQQVGVEPDRCSCGQEFKSRMTFLIHRADALADEVVRLRRIEVAARGFADHVSREDHAPDGFIDSDIGPPACIHDGWVWPCFVERLFAALATDERGEG